MKSTLRLAVAGAMLAASVFGVAQANAADRVIATAPLRPVPGETLLSSVEAHGGNLVWGENQTWEGPFRYFVRDAKGTRQILTGLIAMDLDLGARRGGGTQAVFTAFRTPGRLEILTRDFRSGAIRSLPSLWRPRGVEQSPSAWAGRFAFVRGQVASNVPPLAPARTLGLYATGPLRAITRARTVAIELRGSRLAYITLADPPGTIRATTTLRVATLPSGRGRVRSCLVARGTDRAGGARVALSSPELTGSHVYWLRTDRAAGRGSIRRRRLPSRGCGMAGREERSRDFPGIESFAIDGRRYFYTTQTQVREATDPRITFRR